MILRLDILTIGVLFSLYRRHLSVKFCQNKNVGMINGQNSTEILIDDGLTISCSMKRYFLLKTQWKMQLPFYFLHGIYLNHHHRL
jgi:hypothetical protein